VKRASFTTDALIARTVPYGDTHVILTLLTREHGRRSVMARHARRSTRRFVGGLPTCARLRVELTLPDEGLGQLATSEVMERWDGLAVDPERTARAAVVLELGAGVCNEEDATPGLFDALVGFFRFFEREAEPARADAAWARAQLLLLSHAGWFPSLDVSLRSGRALAVLDAPLWIPDAGLIDATERYDGEHGVPLRAESAEWLLEVARARFAPHTPTDTRRDALKALEAVWSALLSPRPRSFDVLDAMVAR
jgi:recombinational DNA repair protein (RecF pathway)